MQTYYFHVRGKGALFQDEEGMQLPSKRAVLREVLKTRRELARDGDAGRDIEFLISDGTGRTVLRVPLGARRQVRKGRERAVAA